MKQKTTAHPTGHMTYTQVPAVRKKKHFSLISFHSAREKLLFSLSREWHGFTKRTRSMSLQRKL